MFQHGNITHRQCFARHDLSVMDPAKVLGVDRQTLSNLLNGRSGISPKMAVRLQKAFGTPARTRMDIQMDYELNEVMARVHEIQVQPFTKGLLA